MAMTTKAKDKKFRGIPTNPKKRFEGKPITIKNRLGQLSMKLPRIDDKKRWAGYAGLAGTGKKFCYLIPDCKIYVEPFAGTAKVYQEYLKRRIKESKTRKLEGYTAVLNDPSNFVNQFLKKNFNLGIIITMQDFVDCIKKWDSKDTVLLIDGPWFRGSYDQSYSYFNRESVKQYDSEVLSLCTGIPYEYTDKQGNKKVFNEEKYKIKGKFMIASRKENRVFLASKFNKYLIKSVYVVSGKYPLVMCTTNMTFKKSQVDGKIG